MTKRTRLNHGAAFKAKVNSPQIRRRLLGLLPVSWTPR